MDARHEKRAPLLSYRHDALPTERLRWRCDPAMLPFETTAEIEPIPGIVGQDTAVEALRFGLATDASGQNIFVRGLAGTGRLTLVQHLLETIRPCAPPAPDRAYVHSVGKPETPALITLPRGRGGAFRDAVHAIVRFVEDGLEQALHNQATRKRKGATDRRFQEQMERLTKPFDEQVRARGLAVVTVQDGDAVRADVVPVIDGQPVPNERLDALRAEGAVTDERMAEIEQQVQELGTQLEEVSVELQLVRAAHGAELRALYQEEARRVLRGRAAAVRREFPGDGIASFLDALIDDASRHVGRDDDNGRTALYRVNLVQEHGTDEPCPVIIENVPTFQRLVGTLEGGGDAPGHLGIRAGSILRADGGFLILDARDVVSRPEVWTALKSTLRSGQLDISAPETIAGREGPALRPEPIPMQVKVVMLGDSDVYDALHELDPDFEGLFKVLADFDSTIPRDAHGVRLYAGVLARIAKEEGLPPFTRDACVVLAEHGARIAAQDGELTARFGRLVDLAREAVFLTRERSAEAVSGDDFRAAVRRSKARADLPARKFREAIVNGTVRIQTRGAQVGQINGLAVSQAGALTYGFPARITATVAPGSGGTVNIERESDLSGSIHTKGFYILGGLLRHLLLDDHPLVFDASVAFEQSYGGIDGDSASGAEVVCLISALTGLPLRQDLAMTGAIDQLGNVLPIGAANEKIEGFFETCRDIELTGTQGVVVPACNVGDLMLRDDVVEACRAGRFHVYAVDTIHQALGLFTGVGPGAREDGRPYPAGTVLGQAAARARRYWELVRDHL